MPRPSLRLIATAALAQLALSAHAVDFQVIALGGTTALPFATGASTSYQFGVRLSTIAEDGWVGFAPGTVDVASAFMVGEPRARCGAWCRAMTC